MITLGCLSEITCGPMCDGKPGEPRLIGIVLTSLPFWKICIVLRGPVGLGHPGVVDVDGLGAVGLPVDAAAEVDAVQVGLERDRRARGPVRLRPVVRLGVRQPVPAARLCRVRRDREPPLGRGPVAHRVVELDHERLADAHRGLRRRRDERRERLRGRGEGGHGEVLVARRRRPRPRRRLRPRTPRRTRAAAVAVHVLPSAASVPATAAPLALLVTVTLVALPCATCTTIGVFGFTPWVPGLIDTTGRTGAAVVGGAGRSREHRAPSGVPVATARPAPRVRSTSTPSAAGSPARAAKRCHRCGHAPSDRGSADPPILTHATGRPDRRPRPWEVCPDRPRARAGRLGVVGWRCARHVTDEPVEPPGAAGPLIAA